MSKPEKDAIADTSFLFPFFLSFFLSVFILIFIFSILSAVSFTSEEVAPCNPYGGTEQLILNTRHFIRATNYSMNISRKLGIIFIEPIKYSY